jgi:glutathione S-transferase
MEDGSGIAETVAICELLEEAVPTTRSLLGDSMQERANGRMWQRRVEQQIILPLFDAYRW